MEYQQKLIILPAIGMMKEPMTVTAYEAIGTGLCYHAVGGDAKWGWVITHLSSKKALCAPIGTEYEVRLLLERVAEIADWDQDEKELTKPEIATEFKKCQQTVRQELNQRLESAIQASDMPEYLADETINSLQDEDYVILRNALLYAFKIVDK